MSLQICADPFCPNTYEILKLESKVEKLEVEIKRLKRQIKEEKGLCEIND